MLVYTEFIFILHSGNVLKFRTLVDYKKVYTNSEDPDQTASEEAV